MESIKKELPVIYNDPLTKKGFYGQLNKNDIRYYWLEKDIQKLYANLSDKDMKTSLINYTEQEHYFIRTELYESKDT